MDTIVENFNALKKQIQHMQLRHSSVDLTPILVQCSNLEKALKADSFELVEPEITYEDAYSILSMPEVKIGTVMERYRSTLLQLDVAQKNWVKLKKID